MFHTAQSYLILAIFGLAPSIVWLLFYLRKDDHPEPKRMILKVFLWGMIVVWAAALAELAFAGFDYESSLASVSGEMQPQIVHVPGIIDIFVKGGINNPSFFTFILINFIGIAFIEELFKYLVVKFSALRSPEFDEPVDAMIYMIIAALGFAALENILYLAPLKNFLPTSAGDPSILSLTIFRFLGATFLHVLSSATIGYFLALSFLNPKRRFLLISLGILLATLLHGIFNTSIIKSDESAATLFIPIVFLIGFAIFISICFKNLKKAPSACEIN